MVNYMGTGKMGYIYMANYMGVFHSASDLGYENLVF